MARTSVSSLLPARTLMIQGTGSDVGKSLIVAALCRIGRRRGIAVAPFKPQNMSNNAAVCPGGEIGRAQALQARAAGLQPEVDFNPILLKPETDRRAQVVVQGQAADSLTAAAYMASRDARMEAVLDSFARLADAYELILVEGAGSPAEINLRAGDIANMGFARRVGIPVCLVGDIDKGGVIASLVGTAAVLDREDAALIGGFLVNKFRGDPRLFDEGISAIESRTGWRSFGVVPWLTCTANLPAEDAVALDRQRHDAGDGLKVVAPILSRMANFDDADPLRMEPGVDFRWVPPGRPLPRDADMVILFGSKSTLGELAFLRAQGWDHDILAHARAGGRVLGLCGGFQMLGHSIVDAHGTDGPPGRARALGLLDVNTEMSAAKTVHTVHGRCVRTGLPVAGYEIHVGGTTGPDCARPMFHLGGRTDGARSADGRIEGSYLHGIFTHDEFRQAWLRWAGVEGSSALDYGVAVEAALDGLADGVERALDIDGLLACAAPPVVGSRQEMFRRASRP